MLRMALGIFITGDSSRNHFFGYINGLVWELVLGLDPVRGTKKNVQLFFPFLNMQKKY